MNTKYLGALFTGLTVFAPQLYADDLKLEQGYLEFETQVVEFEAARNYRAGANLYLPKEPSRRNFPALILQFGSKGDKDVDYIVGIGQGLARRGFVVMTTDMPGRGLRKMTSPEPGDYEDLVSWYMEDYAFAVDYLAALPQVDSGNIHYAGTSLGAMTGIPFCAKDMRIKTCISIVGGGPLQSELPAELDCVQTVEHISPRATLLINSMFDLIVPYASAKNMHNRAKFPVEKFWYPSDHFLRGIDNEDLYNRMAGFMTKYGS